MKLAFVGKIKNGVLAFVSGLVIGGPIALFMASPSELWLLFQKIPATFWGVLIGAFFSLGGVALTNRASDRRLRAQLDHDRTVKDRDRELSLRKDVYLAAAEAISAGFLSVGRFANLDVPHHEITAGYVEKSPSIAKVHVIAREDTARAVANLMGELGAVFLRLFVKRAPLVAQKQQLALLKQQMDDIGKERDHMVELMKQLNLDGSDDLRRKEIVNKNFDFEQQRVLEKIKQHDQLWAVLSVAQLQYMQECIGEMAKLTLLMVPAVVAIRRELDLPIDEVAYRKILEEGLRKQEASMKDFLASVGPKAVVQPKA